MTTQEFNRRNNNKAGVFAQYLHNKEMRAKVTFRCDGEGNMYYLLGGNKIPVKQFNLMYPIENINRSKNGQLDGRSNFY